MIFELFSQRAKTVDRNGTPDVYQYDQVPRTLRVQVQQIMVDSIGPQYVAGAYDLTEYRHNADTWDLIAKTLRREFGVHRLGKGNTAAMEVLAFLGECDAREFIDVVEVCVRAIHSIIATWTDHHREIKGIEQSPADAIEELNYRFRQSGFGFQFAEGRAFRVDSEFGHEEVVKPALRVLTRPGYEGAQEEFLNAYRHYRNGDFEEAIVQAARAFESTLKITCDTNEWQYGKGARASDLLNVVKAAGLWPDYMDRSFDQLVATLASGLPKVRNEQSAHGQGGVRRSTPPYVAAYALHLAAAKIVLLSEASATREHGGQLPCRARD